MAGSRLSTAPRFRGSSSDPGARSRFRPSAFQWIPALLVLCIVVMEFVSVRGGADFVPYALPPEADPPSGPGVLLLRALGAAVYPVLALLVSRRFPLWDGPGRRIGYYLGGLLLLHGAAYLGGVLLGDLGIEPFHGWAFFGRKSFEFVLFTAFAHGMIYGERLHAKEQEELRLRAVVAESDAERVRAQMRRLSMEWSPGFLTGTLDSIEQLLVARDVAGARRMLLGLSSVLRHVLAHLRNDTVRLEKEVELVRGVLAVEALRRPGLWVEWTVEQSALDLRVLPMSLLTLVHQALQQCGGAETPRLRVGAVPRGGAVRLRVDASGACGRGGEAQAVSSTPPGGPLPPRNGAERHIRRRWIAADRLRLELCWEAAPRAAGPDREPIGAAEARPVDLEGSSPSPYALPPEDREVGRGLAIGTYAVLVLSCAALAVHSAALEVAQGGVALAAPGWVYVAGSGLYAALWWGSFAIAAHVLSARFPIHRRNWPRRLLPHIAGAILVSALNSAAFLPFQQLVVAGGGIFLGLMKFWEWGSLAVYLPLAGIGHGFAYAREYRARRIAELRLRSELWESELHRTEAELQALKAELNPHFLFNSLNTVASLMHGRVEEAQHVVALLSGLLRRVLESGSLQEVSVEEEIEFLRLYAEIEKARFGSALHIEYQVDASALRARVPHLLLQPLVENAVKHGFRPRGGTGRITLSVQRACGSLQLTVTDDGVGLAARSAAEGGGTGLHNVRQRLRQRYGSEHHFELAPTPGGGTRACIRIPFSEQPMPLRRSVPLAALAAV